MPVRPMLLHRMALVSSRLFCKNLGNLQEFFGQMVYRPPWPKIARTPMFTVSPVAGCTEVHLAGWELFHHSCWESGTDKFFPSNLSLKCLKWLQKALFMLCCCF